MAISSEQPQPQAAFGQAKGSAEQPADEHAADLPVAEALAREVAERKRIEAALRASEATARALLSVPTDVALLADADSIILDANETAAERLGLPLHELVGKSVWDLLPAEVAARRRPYMEQVLRTGAPLRVEDQHKGRWFDNSVFPIFDTEGRVTRVAVMARDITDRKETEQALHDSEAAARGLLNALDDIALFINADGICLEANNALLRVCGISRDELVGKPVWNIFPADVNAYRKAALQEVLRTGQRVRLEEHRGGRWYDTVVYPVDTTPAAPARFAILALDVTERKEIEAALRESEARYRSLFDNSPAALWEEDLTALKRELARLRDEEGIVDFEAHFRANPDALRSLARSIRVVDANQAAVVLYQAEGKEHLRAGLYEDFTEAGERDLCVELEAIARGVTQFEMESLALTLRGETRHVLLKWTAAPGHEQDLSRVLVSELDISARRRAEQALEQSEARYRALFEESPAALLEMDYSEAKRELDRLRAAGVRDFRTFLAEHPETVVEQAGKVRILDVNRAALVLYGARSKQDLLVGGLIRTFADKSYQVFANRLVAMAAGVLHHQAESVTRTLTGDLRQINLTWVVVSGYEESLARVLVSIEDITERKRGELALRESEARYRALFEDSPVALWEEDFTEARRELVRLQQDEGVRDFRAYFQAHPDALLSLAARIRVTDVNQAAVNLYRAGSKERLCAEVYRVIPEGGYADLAAEFEAVAHGAVLFETEHLGCTLDGEERTLITKWTAAPGFEQSLARVLVSVVDISERKLLERALRASLEQADRSQRLVLALGAAAQAVQRAHTPEEIYQTIGREVAGLGLHALVLEATADRSHLIVRHTTWEPTVVAAVEAQIGVPVLGYRVPLSSNLMLSGVMASGQSVYARAPLDSVRNVLPGPLKPRAWGLMEMLDISRVVCAPLGQNNQTHGVLIVTGPSLTETDLEAIEAFASQTAIALSNVRLYQQLEAAAAELEQRVEERTAALSASEARYRTLFDRNQDGLCVIDRQGRCLAANDAAGQIVGYTPQELRGLDLYQFMSEVEGIPAERRAEALEAGWAAMQQGLSGQRVVLLHRSGQPVQTEVSFSGVDYAGQEAVLAVVRDITERRQAEQALRRSREEALRGQRLLLALSQAAERVQHARTQEEVFEIVGAEVGRLGYQVIVMLRAEDDDHLVLKFATWQAATLQAAEALAGVAGVGLRVPLAPDGLFRRILTTRQSSFHPSTVDLAIQGFPRLGRGLLERLAGMLGIERGIYAPLVVGDQVEGLLAVLGKDLNAGDLVAVDVLVGQASVALENVRLVAELRAGRQQMQHLAHEVVTGLEQERVRISRVLHDEAGQMLTVLKISLELAAEDLAPELADIRQRILGASDLAGETMEGLRRLAQDLRPPALDSVGLNHTLRGLCQAFGQRTRLVIDYQGQELPELPEAIKITLYRFLQEALTNVAKHASARQVWVTVNYDAEAIRVLVRDNGQGFDPRAEGWKSGQAVGMGLLGMRERLSALGGWLEIVSEPGKETSVVAYVPLEWKNNA